MSETETEILELPAPTITFELKSNRLVAHIDFGELDSETYMVQKHICYLAKTRQVVRVIQGKRRQEVELSLDPDGDKRLELSCALFFKE